MSKTPYGKNFEYDFGKHAYKRGDRVTVNTGNGCSGNGTVKTIIRDNETGEVMYQVQMESGTMRGAPYFASESQLTPGWGAAGTCGDEVVSAVNSRDALDASTLSMVVAGLLMLGAGAWWVLRPRGVAHAA